MTPGSRALTGLRGAAALLVVGHHCYLREGLHLPLLNGMMLRGYLAVDLFFVLSGFVMAWMYGDWFTRSFSLPRYIEFMIRRVARLWPLHVSIMLMVLGYHAAVGFWPYWPKMIMTNLLMVQSWGFSTVINAPSWSVSTEMLAYLLFPMLVTAVLRGAPARAWVTAAAAALLLVAVIWVAPDRGAGRRGALDIYNNWSVLPALRCIGGFTLGMVAFRATGISALVAMLRPSMVAGGAGLMALALLALGAPDWAVYAAFPVLTASLFVGAGLPQAMLGSRAMQGLGSLSYAIYLVHVPLLETLPIIVGTQPRVLVPVFFAATVSSAMLLHAVIERPGRIAIRRIRLPGSPLQAG